MQMTGLRKDESNEKDASAGVQVILVTTILATYVFTILLGIAQAVHNFAQDNYPIAWVFVAMVVAYGVLLAVTLANVGSVQKGGLALYARVSDLEKTVLRADPSRLQFSK